MQSEGETPSTNGHGRTDAIVSPEVIRDVLSGPPPPLTGDITFEATPTGYEVWYSDRIATEHPGLVDESADWLEDQLGVLNLGQIEHTVLMADGILTDEIKSGLIGWWSARVEDLDLGGPSSGITAP
jgi:hypothetical protein